MMIKNLALLSVSAFSTYVYGYDNVCYEYPSDSYQIINSKSVAVKDPRTQKFDYKDLTTKLDSHKYRLILAGSKAASKLYPHYFFLLDKQSNDMLDFQTSECPSPLLDPKRLCCYGECDSGIYSIEKDGRVNFKTDGITIGETVDAPEGTWDIRAAQGADLPKPTAITCPVTISLIDLDPNKDNQAHIENGIKYLVEPISYVCYHSKELSAKNHKALYKGCRFTRGQCDSYYPGWKQFGHYGSEKAAMQAFKRCRHSTPRLGK